RSQPIAPSKKRYTSLVSYSRTLSALQTAPHRQKLMALGLWIDTALPSIFVASGPLQYPDCWSKSPASSNTSDNFALIASSRSTAAAHRNLLDGGRCVWPRHTSSLLGPS